MHLKRPLLGRPKIGQEPLASLPHFNKLAFQSLLGVHE
jgi:hypothetical protein